MKPIMLPANQPPARFYQGGERIADFRGDKDPQPNTPEDWVGSTTSVRGRAPIGMTRLEDGRLLSDAITSEPLTWLGEDHVARYGDDVMLLVKLLDAGQRLPVHAHPDGDFAASHVAAGHGKAEAWYILSPGTVYLSLTQDLTAEELLRFVENQDISTLLSLMHEVTVDVGDCVFVPHGVLHAIGPGILLAEVQEPEDLSILLEWEGFDLDGPKDGHLDIGFELALSAVEATARSHANIESLIRRGVVDANALPEEASPFFRLDKVNTHQTFPAGFAILIALDGPVHLIMNNGEQQELARGTTTLIPYTAGDYRVEGSALIARPPLP
ncbi:MAG: class I mannose-6-phosphate isomerase [Candidatus Nanopelagicales bacterium]|jgi:mannose-6-phosphate isomerase|nr:class I mannose-6-phosphate isomerase [Pontimonas sp.]MDP4805399.1 class I mannose-6-phosphate isomerase [Candidatus Nanopelagicales bacterium]